MRRWSHEQEIKPFSPEVRERSVRMVLEHRGEYPYLWATIESIAPRSAACPKPSMTGFASTRSTKACAMASALKSAPASKTSNAKSRNCAKPTKSSSLRALFLPRRISTADGSLQGVCRQTSRHTRGRADLQSAANCPVWLQAPCCPPTQARAALRPGETR